MMESRISKLTEKFLESKLGPYFHTAVGHAWIKTMEKDGRTWYRVYYMAMKDYAIYTSFKHIENAQTMRDKLMEAYKLDLADRKAAKAEKATAPTGKKRDVLYTYKVFNTNAPYEYIHAHNLSEAKRLAGGRRISRCYTYGGPMHEYIH